jgi:pSer/pThr/pTyr-binding forkhead associated (FHA) protein
MYGKKPMASPDPFKEQTVFHNPDDEFTVSKSASIYAGRIPRLEAHNKSKQLSNKAFGIGRDKHNAVIILDEKVSKFHAVITFHQGKGFIRDIHSTNGTFINNNRLVPNKNVELNNNDTISVGNTEITYYC